MRKALKALLELESFKWKEALYEYIHKKRITALHNENFFSSPSTSLSEDLPPEFDKAEKSGLRGDCAKYEKQCNVNVLNVFSKII